MSQDRPAKRILVTTDMSEASRPALVRAAEEADRAPAEVTLLYVIDFARDLPPGVLSLSAAAEKEVRDEIEARVRPGLEAMRQESFGESVPVEVQLVDGHNAAEVICRYAGEHDIDEIIIATHGRSGISHFMIGSVAERVVRHAPCDVRVVRSEAPDEED